MRGNSSLALVLAALKELGGYFTFAAEDGAEYVIISQTDFASLQQAVPEVQLPLPATSAGMPANAASTPARDTSVSADVVLDKINRDIALFRSLQEEAPYDDLAAETPAATETPLPPPRRVRFEPLRGDLPPELQD